MNLAKFFTGYSGDGPVRGYYLPPVVQYIPEWRRIFPPGIDYEFTYVHKELLGIIND